MLDNKYLDLYARNKLLIIIVANKNSKKNF